MKIFNTVMKVVAALAAVAGAVYVIATYGDKIVAWAKKLLGKCCCCDDCACADCECNENGECTCECECEDCECCDCDEGDCDEGDCDECAQSACDSCEEVTEAETVEATEKDFEA